MGMTPRTFIVNIELLCRQKVEVMARDEDQAEQIALDTYSLVGADVRTETVTEIEEVTAYRCAS